MTTNNTTQNLIKTLSIALLLSAGSAMADVSFDGLELQKRTKADAVWLHPELSLEGYDKIMYENLGVATKPVRRNSRTDFELTVKQREKVSEILDEAFNKELGRSERFELASTPGPDTLAVRVSLLDVVSHVPEESVGRTTTYISSVGEATLVLELRDSVSNAILARAVDTQSADSMGQLIRSSRPINIAETRQTASQWARLLRKRLDEFRK
ncbi:MAG: DUF3313 family protein [Xanthomonadales bacterium]|nr:DUF3313 family protein [Xanthomonadales bacterium]